MSSKAKSGLGLVAIIILLAILAAAVPARAQEPLPLPSAEGWELLQSIDPLEGDCHKWKIRAEVNPLRVYPNVLKYNVRLCLPKGVGIVEIKAGSDYQGLLMPHGLSDRYILLVAPQPRAKLVIKLKNLKGKLKAKLVVPAS